MPAICRKGDSLSTGHICVGTTTLNTPGQSTVRANSILIARVGDNFVQIFDGGWQSVTTKSRLNALLQAVTPNGGVFQRDWTWYYNSSKVGTVPFFSGMEAA